MTVDLPDWMPEAQSMLAAWQGVSTQIAALLATGSPNGTPGGVPLLHGWDSLVASQLNVAAQTSNSVTVNFTKPGYFFAIWAGFTAGGAVNPFMGVTVQWKDPASGNQIAQEDWAYPIANTGQFVPIYGRGPCKSSRAVITFTNFDAAVSAVAFFDLSETTHHISRDDWRGSYFGGVPVYTAPPISNQLGGILGAGNNILLAINANVAYLLPLYSGQVYLMVSTNQSLNIIIQTKDPTVPAVTVWQVNLVNAQLAPQSIPLPRSPCIITFTNPSGANTVTFSWYMGYLEYAS